MKNTVPVTGAKLKLLLQQVLDMLGRHDVEVADGIVSDLLRQNAGDAEVLQVAGLIKAQKGNLSAAEELYQRSLAVEPRQPHVRSNLGNLLRKTMRFQEALGEFREAIRLDRNYIDARLLLGMTLQDLGQLEEAQKEYENLLRLQPSFLPAQQCLGTVLNERGAHDAAERVFREALNTADLDVRQRAALEYNLAIVMQQQGRHELSLELLKAAEERVPTLPGVDYSRGNAQQMLGHTDEAIASYRKAIERNPLNLAAHRELNELLYRTADDANFLRSYDEAARQFPDAGVIRLVKGRQLILTRNYEIARAELERAVQLLPNSTAARDGLGIALARIGEFESAIHVHEEAIRIDERDAGLRRNLGETLLRQGDAEKALAILEGSLSLNPDDQSTVALWTTALRLLDDPRSDWIQDVDNLVEVFEIEKPAGTSDVRGFNGELNAWLDGLHLDKREMLNQSLRGGTQTLDNLFTRNSSLLTALKVRIDEAVSAYIERMDADPSHPLKRRRGRGFSYAGSWSARLHDCGFHTNHYHHKGWISSAYYVDLPDAVADTEGKKGWLKFGEPGFATALPAPILRFVQPKIGRLVLFPSYLWHGTVPFQSTQARTSIAFDVVPQ